MRVFPPSVDYIKGAIPLTQSAGMSRIVKWRSTQGEGGGLHCLIKSYNIVRGRNNPLLTEASFPSPYRANGSIVPTHFLQVVKQYWFK